MIDKAICYQQLGNHKEMPALSKQHHYMMLTAAVSLLQTQLFQSLNTNDFGELKAIVRAEYCNIALQNYATYSLQLISAGYFTSSNLFVYFAQGQVATSSVMSIINFNHLLKK